jgi:hypothetical protein
MAEPPDNSHELPVGASPLNGRTPIHEDQRTALNVVLTSFSHDLRTFKQLEFQWFALYLTITLPCVAYMSTRAGGFPAGLLERVVVCGVYWLLTIWIMNVLSRIRQSYYRVLRMVKRLQTSLGLDSLNLMSSDMREQIFPKGFGRFPQEDNTKKLAGYTDRLVPVLVAYLCLVVAVFKEPIEITARTTYSRLTHHVPFEFAFGFEWVCVAMFVAFSFGWFLWCLLDDGPEMASELRRERMLAGTYSSDYGRQ